MYRRCHACIREQALQTFAPSLCLPGILTGNVAPDIFFFLFDELVLRLEFQQIALIALFALVQVSAVVAAVFFQIGGHLKDGVHHLIEKIAVMRNNEDRAGPGFEIIFQPLYCGDVQMVGGFIQQQQIRLRQQQARQ